MRLRSLHFLVTMNPNLDSLGHIIKEGLEDGEQLPHVFTIVFIIHYAATHKLPEAYPPL